MTEHEPAPIAISPLGHTIDEARQRRAATNPEHRSAYEALAVARQVARQVIEYRMDHGLTERQLAISAGCHILQVGRIESGRHTPTMEVLQRFAGAMGKQLSVSFVDVDASQTR